MLASRGPGTWRVLVIPRELLASARVPGAGELRCYRHDQDFSLWLDRTELMSSRVHESEEMLADVALEALGPHRGPSVLVGGLGMGFTLARVLQVADAAAVVEVVELVPEVVAWNRTWFAALTGRPLDDPRVLVRLGDVADTIAAAKSAYDVVLLDVDNGPAALVHPGNARIYADRGLVAARTALRPGGVLAVWSSADNPPFASRLKGTGFVVTAHRTRARGRKGPRRTIWTAVRP
jgi:spermidine synthase